MLAKLKYLGILKVLGDDDLRFFIDIFRTYFPIYRAKYGLIPWIDFRFLRCGKISA